jgi:hypothetical protein
MGEGLGGGAGAGGKSAAEKNTQAKGAGSCRCFMLVPRSSMDRVYEIWMSGAAIWAGITPPSPPPSRERALGSSSAPLLAGCFRCFGSLFLAVICRWCQSKSEGFCGRGRPRGCIFAGFTAVSATPAPLQRRIRQARAKACLNAAQTSRCAFIASSTAGTMPKKAWIIPGNSLYSAGTPARCSASAYR